MHISFNRRRILVAGGSRGIGRSIALGFAAAGADVAICARGLERLRQTEAELRNLGASVHASACDLADGDAVTAWVDGAAEALGGIDVLVNNASGFARSDDEAGWGTSIDVDLMASVRASRAALPWLEENGGSIVHIASISGLAPSVRTPAYGAAKAALIQYTMTQASALAGRRIRVNCVAPGSIDFPGGVWDEARRRDP
ncbi:MAG: SDR family oxidoreductase, partial [Burkholderiales bacterium]